MAKRDIVVKSTGGVNDVAESVKQASEQGSPSFAKLREMQKKKEEENPAVTSRDWYEEDLSGLSDSQRRKRINELQDPKVKKLYGWNPPVAAVLTDEYCAKRDGILQKRKEKIEEEKKRKAKQ